MVASTASISRNMFDLDNQYYGNVVQQGVPWVDADDNDFFDQVLSLEFDVLREIIVGITRFRGDAYLIQEATAKANNFDVGGTYAFLNGLPAYLGATVEYASDGSSKSEKNIHAISTGLAALTLSDSSANWVVNELAGRELQPDITDATTFTIASNTATTITVSSGDMTSVADLYDTYAILMTTPSGGDRTDAVFINVWRDPVDQFQDPNLVHALGAGVEAQQREKVRTVIEVQQGADTYADYVDTDGHQHYRVKIASIERFDGVDDIETADITDLRPIQEQSIMDLFLVSHDTDGTLLPGAAFGGAIDRFEIDMLRPTEQTVPDDTIEIKAGIYTKADNTGFVNFTVASSAAFAQPGTPGNTRYYLVQLTDAGAIDISKFNEVGGAGAPFADTPAPDSDKQAICIVKVDENPATVVVNTADITDVREFFNAGGGTGTAAFDLKDLRPSQQDTPDDTVKGLGGTYSDPLDPTAPAVTVADGWADALTFGSVSADSRIDLLVLDEAGAGSIVAGAEAASPVPAAYPADKIVVAEVTIDETGAVTILDADIRDVRPFITNPGFLPDLEDLAVATAGEGPKLQSPDTTLWEVSVNNDGDLVVTDTF